MSIVSIPFTFSAGAVIIAAQHNSNFSTIYSDYNGNIQNVNIASNAAIVYSKLSLSNSIVNADIGSSAGIVGSKLDLSTPGSIGGTSPGSGAFTTLKVGTTHQGDVIYDNGTSLVRLTPGTSGQFLQTQGSSANPQWASASSILVSNTSVSTANNTGDIAITNTKYYLVICSLSLVSGADTFALRFNNDTGSDYKYVTRGFDTGATAANSNSASATSIFLGPQYAGTFNIVFHILPQDSSHQGWVKGSSWGNTNVGSTFGYNDFFGYWISGTSNYTTFRILTTGTATFSGNVIVYELKQS